MGSATRAARLAALKDELTPHLEEIRALFLRRRDVKLTLVIRCPWMGDGDIVLTDDEPSAAIAAIQHLEADL